jgi:rRNA small subunit pseudouridine methyltransferase Nep1
MVNLFRDRRVKSDDGTVLMELADGTFIDLIKSIKAEKIVGLSTTGVKSTVEKVAGNCRGVENCVFVVGGFPRGHFAESTTRQLGPVYSISDVGLEAHVVIARLVYECEKLLQEGVDHEGDKERSKVGA